MFRKMSNFVKKPEAISTNLQGENGNKQNWIPLRLVKTEIQKCVHNRLLRFRMQYFPKPFNWQFSRSGRVATSLIFKPSGDAFDSVVLDIYNKIWSIYTLKGPEHSMQNVYTYYMLDEDKLVVVKMPHANTVTQQMFEMNHETKGVELIHTKTHAFLPREEPFCESTNEWTEPESHLPLVIDGKEYVCMYSTERGENIMVYLLPADPRSSDIEIKEFFLSTIVTEEHEETLRAFTGTDYEDSGIQGPAFTQGKYLFYSACVSLASQPEEPSPLYGVFIRIDVSKLYNVHNRPFGEDVESEMEELDKKQRNAFELIMSPNAKILNNHWPDSCCSYNGAVVLYEEDSEDISHMATTYVLGNEKTDDVHFHEGDWFSMHPCGALLQFRMYKGEMFVKLASVYKNTLEAMLTSKHLIQPDNQIGSIEGLHRMLFAVPPLPLDEEAKKMLQIPNEFLELPEEKDPTVYLDRPIVYGPPINNPSPPVPEVPVPGPPALPPPRIMLNEWMYIRVGDAWPTRTLIKALDKTLDTVAGENPDQYVALWYMAGEPVMGRVWNENGKVAANFGWFKNEYKGNVGSIQILVQLSEHVRGFDYSWVPFCIAALFGEMDWHPVYVNHHKGVISPAVITFDGKQILGKTDVRNEKCSAGFGGKENQMVGPTCAANSIVLCRKAKPGYKFD